MARREDYLTPEVLADVDEVDRYLATLPKIDYSKGPGYMKGDYEKDCDRSAGQGKGVIQNETFDSAIDEAKEVQTSVQVSPDNIQEPKVSIHTRGEYIRKIAWAYHKAGLNVLPLAEGKKHPPFGLKWKKFGEERMSDAEFEYFFSAYPSDGLGLVTGKGSGNAEAIDIDTKNDPGEKVFNRFRESIKDLPVFQNLIKTKTRNGGRHLIYRCPEIDGSKKLTNAEGVVEAAIETRGKNAFLVLPPTEGYSFLEGTDLMNIQTISAEDRNKLHQIAANCGVGNKKLGSTTTDLFLESRSHDFVKHEVERNPFGHASMYSQKTNPFEVLKKHGWQSLGKAMDGKVHYRRPGKNEGVSANWDPESKVFYVHTTSSVIPKGANTSFGVFAYLEHNGDFITAERAIIDGFLASSELPKLITAKDLPRTKDDLEKIRPEVDIEGLAYRGGSLAIGGTTKVGKSIFVTSLLIAAATGGSFMGKKMKKMRVLLIDCEVDSYEIFKRIHGVAPKDESGTAQYSENLFILSLRKHPDLLDREKLLPFIKKLKDMHGFDLIVLDCAYQIMGGLDENANGQMTELGRFFSELQKGNTTLVVVHHFAKGESHTKSVWDRFRGASSFGALFDACIVLAAHEKEDHLIAEFGARSFRGDPPIVLKYDPFPKLVIAEGEDPSKYRKPGKQAVESDPIVGAIRDNPRLGTMELSRHFHVSQQTVRDRAAKAGFRSVKVDGSTVWATDDSRQITPKSKSYEKTIYFDNAK